MTLEEVEKLAREFIDASDKSNARTFKAFDERGGVFDPVCMDFDHRDSATKIAPVAHMVAFGFELLRAEIAKCDVVCSNCHRIRTFRRRQHGQLIAKRQAETKDEKPLQLDLLLASERGAS